MNSTPGKTINFTPYSEAAMMTVPTLISNVGQRINRSSNFKKVDTLGSQCEIPIDQKAINEVACYSWTGYELCMADMRYKSQDSL
jgi:hypothetical protein